MSLETQIGSLVSAANKLTSEVSGKLSEIDQKVDQATQAVPQAIRDSADMVFYVNAETGDDNNSGLGGTQAVRTIAAVSDKIVPGTQVQISLRRGQVHEMEGDVLRATGCSIIIRDWGTEETGPKPVISYSPTYNPDSGSNNGRGMILTNCSLTFLDVEIKVINLDNGSFSNGYAGLLVSNQSHLNVYVRSCKIEIDNYAFIATYPGYDSADLNIQFTDVISINNSSGKGMLIYGRAEPEFPNFRFSGLRVNTSGASLAALLPVNTSRSNVLSNIDI